VAHLPACDRHAANDSLLRTIVRRKLHAQLELSVHDVRTGVAMSDHVMQAMPGAEPEQQCCSLCKMSYQQFVDNGKPRCPGRPHTNADLWPDIRVKYHPDDTDWMHWAKTFTQDDGRRL
jgi:hypothetical protein